MGLRRTALGATLALAVVAPVLVLPFVHWWSVNTEGLTYIIRMVELQRCWEDGLWSAGWFPDLAWGQGYPFLLFYAPLVYFLAGLFTLVGANIVLSLKSSMVVAALLGAVGAYRLARLALDRRGAAVAAVLYTYAPVHITQLHTRGDLAEFLAAGFLPWCVEGVLGLRKFPSARRIAQAAIAGAGAILAHNLLGLYTGAAMFLVAIIAVSMSAQPRRTTAAVLVSGTLTLALSAFFWVPVLIERKWVKLERVAEGWFAVEQNFRPLENLLGFGKMPLPMFGKPIDIGLGLPAIVLAAAALLAHRRWPREAAPLALTAVLLAAGGAFLTTSASRAVYEALPLLRYTQFPWRFACLAALGTAILGAIGFASITRGWRPATASAAVVVVALVAVSFSWKHFAAATPVVHMPSLYQPATLRAQPNTTTGRNEYMPIWVGKLERPEGFTDGVKVIGAATVTDVVRRTGRYDLRVEAREAAIVVLQDLYYPTWTGTLDGRPVTLRGREGAGNIEVDVPPGASTLLVRFGPTPLRLATALISAAAALVTAIMLGRSRHRDRPARSVSDA